MAENHALIPEAATMYTQTDAMKEIKDLSKNLVSDDFERQYKAEMAEKNGRRRNTGFLTIAISIGALAIWLLVVTVRQELQISRLRQEVDQLTANMIAISASLKSLNNKISSNGLLTEFETSEDTIYTDDLESIGGKDSKELQNSDSLDKLRDVTVLEDENMQDDEDMYGDDDGESGFYEDYDKRRERIGTTNMVKLKPDDFTDSVLFEKDNPALMENMRQIKKMINDNPENPDIAFPPSLPATTEQELSRDKRHVFPDATPDAVEQVVSPRVMAKTDERRKTKKFLPTAELATKVPQHSVVRTARNSDNEERRPFVAAHFHGNTSHLSTEIHEHYKGNGLVRVPHDQHHDVWYPSSWTLASPHPRPTLTRNGHVHVRHTGVYLVYVQIYYLDSHDVVAWVLRRNNEETLMQCAQSTHSSEALEKANSCFSASALFLRDGDRLTVKNTGGDRHSLMQPEKSFIGLIKLADAEDPQQEL